MRFDGVIFDLDGTLLDTLSDIAACMNRVLQANGLPTYSLDEYRYLVGSGLREMIAGAVPENRRDPSLVQALVDGFGHEYNAHWADTSRPYEGIVKLLAELHEAGMLLAVLSNKPDAFTQAMVKQLLPAQLFDLTLGHREPFPLKPAPDSALHILREFGITPERAAFVGDMAIDMHTARNAGIASVGVEWGFRPCEELLEAGATHVASSPSALGKWLRQGRCP
ncbi:MAG: HAD family hydrolase [Candidatus Cloacimonetes bacterium]|nr:HAD family hydrolase [Candidatus Cloacimonadota bacterium]